MTDLHRVGRRGRPWLAQNLLAAGCGASMGCGGSTEAIRGPELDQYMAPYLGTWAVKCEASSSTNLCKDGYRDLAEISTDTNACPGGLPPWHNGFILFSKDGCTEVTHGSPQWGMSNNNNDPSGGGKIVGVGVARQATKRLTINHGPGG